ncbi:unnamed protein product [Natator depressus]
MKSLLRLSLLLLLAAVLVQGMPTSSRGRCLCVTAGVPAIHPKHIAKVEIYGQSSSCQQVERHTERERAKKMSEQHIQASITHDTEILEEK